MDSHHNGQAVCKSILDVVFDFLTAPNITVSLVSSHISRTVGRARHTVDAAAAGAAQNACGEFVCVAHYVEHHGQRCCLAGLRTLPDESDTNRIV